MTLASLVNGDRATLPCVLHTAVDLTIGDENGLARSATVDKRQPMRAGLVTTSLRVLTWCSVILLAVLSLLPGQALDALSLLPVMKVVRTVFPLQSSISLLCRRGG